MSINYSTISRVAEGISRDCVVKCDVIHLKDEDDYTIICFQWLKEQNIEEDMFILNKEEFDILFEYGVASPKIQADIFLWDTKEGIVKLD